jgi:hypothetical protein
MRRAISFVVALAMLAGGAALALMLLQSDHTTVRAVAACGCVSALGGIWLWEDFFSSRLRSDPMWPRTMRLYECSHCKKVNRVTAFRLVQQPICGNCGHEINDFPFSKLVRKIWYRRWLSFAVLALVVGAVLPIQLAQQAAPPTVWQEDNVLTVADSQPQTAPFTIKTPPASGGYYIKLQLKGSTTPYMTIFVNAGSYFATAVALGDYDVFYATGDRWVGLHQKVKFWPTMDRYKLSETFSFTATQERIKDMTSH